ncbi:lipase family protein [Virgisporangium aurantiacum]|uniref:Lipase n=1 Tax=Virgisporangium aurantiacum TaxID=175570 RepID=A0A8J3Z735_9ACTN|nr:lipase family protein [Virgisporangium aurantiacum]GIJ56520.1 lipase [Virgisporangium aurantiacum]
MTIPPSEDPFYAPVADPGRPGGVLRKRTVTLPVGVPVDAHQVVYGSTGARGQAIAVSGTVLVPRAAWTGPGPRPIVSYGVGVHGLTRDAAPGHLMRLGEEAEVALFEPLLARGWAVAVTDGDGHGMPGPHTYGAGLPGGHAMLDVVRAAVRVRPDLDRAAPVLLWGYSEGGRNAAWAAELHPGYAPDLDLRGVAAGGVPADLRAVAEAIDGGPFSGLGLAVVVGLSHAYGDPALEAVLTPDGRRAAARAAGRDVVGLIVEHPEPLRHHTGRDNAWEDPAWRVLLDRERNGRGRPRAPLYLYHAPADEIVPVAVGRRLLADYHAAGADVVWADVAAGDHLTAGFTGSRAAIDWLTARVNTAVMSPAG